MKVRVKRTQWSMGIDPSLTGFGVAFWHPDNTLFNAVRFTSKLKGVDRLIDITTWMNGVVAAITNYDIGQVCMEGYSFASRNSHAHSLGELGGAVKLELCRMFPDPRMYPCIVPPKTLKKFVTDNGNASKEQSMLAVYKKWGYEASNNDLADAYALARLGACMLGSDQPHFSYESEVLKGLERWTERPAQPYK